MRASTEKKYKAMVDEYFTNGFNGTKAYKKFNPNSNDDSARAEFPKILAIPSIAKYVEKKHQDASKSSYITHSDIVKTLKSWLEADTTEFITLSPQEVKKLPIELRRLITGFTYTKTSKGKGKNKVTEEKVTFKFVNKSQAAQMLSKHIGFFGEHNYQKAIPLSDLTPAERRKKLNDFYKRIKESSAIKEEE